MARLAVISDIHGNHVAFERVLVDIERRAVDAVLCLGDIVGYGPDPKECLDLARKACKLIVRGNHENGVLAPETSESWNPLARVGIAHSRACLAAEDLEYIAKLPLSFIISGQILGVHDSPMPSDHGMNYLRTRADAAQAFRWLDVAIALVGHTHVPACFATIADPAAIVAPDDVDAFVRQARRLLCDATVRRDFSVAARARAETFSTAHMVDAMTRLYEEVIT